MAKVRRAQGVFWRYTNTIQGIVYIPLKPPFPIPSDNTALRVRVSTPLQTTVSLRLLPPGRYRDNENEAIFRWAKTPFLFLFLLVAVRATDR